MLSETKKILVVEDNPAFSSIVQFHLERVGYEVIVAFDGREARQRIRHSSDLFDLVITDQQMPHVSGEQLVRHLQQDTKYSRIPIIMLTAKALELDVTRLRDEFNIAAVIAKPFSPTDLVGTVEACLGMQVSP